MRVPTRSSSCWLTCAPNGFKFVHCDCGGTEFVRAFSDEAYDIPPERVIGSSSKTRFELRDGKAEVIKLPEIASIDDREGKPINISLHIRRRPILAFGNSDGDLQMLELHRQRPRARGCRYWCTMTTTIA